MTAYQLCCVGLARSAFVLTEHIPSRSIRGIRESGVRRHWRLFVTITPLLQSMEDTATDRYVLCCLCTWCCQCLLHLSYVLSMCLCYGAWNTPGAVSASCTGHMCWLYLVLRMHLCKTCSLLNPGFNNNVV